MTIMPIVKSVSLVGVLPAGRIVQVHPGGIALKMPIFPLEQVLKC